MSNEVANKAKWNKAKSMAMKKYSKDGKWNARIAQQAVRIYKNELGGTYKGPKKKTSLSKWTAETWTYHPTDKKQTGRYLPKSAWSLLTPEQVRTTNRNKRNGKGKRVKYEPFVTKALKKRRVLK